MLHGVGHSVALNVMRSSVQPQAASLAVHQPHDGHAHGAPAGAAKGTRTADPTGPGTTGTRASADESSTTSRALSESERQQVAELKTRDRQVRAHEMAHKAAAGRYGGPVSYDYQAGPDGHRYAVGGEVAIDSASIPGDPEATIHKMQVIARAALAPAQPSAQDRSVAVQAQQTAANARRELLAERMGEKDGVSEPNSKAASEQYEDVPTVGHAVDTRV